MKKWIVGLVISLVVVATAQAADKAELSRKIRSGVTLNQFLATSQDNQVIFVLGAYFAMMQSRAMGGQTLCVPPGDPEPAETVANIVRTLRGMESARPEVGDMPIENMVFGAACAMWPEKTLRELGAS
ncbi:hypothetical protein [Rhodanobacter denitrificans]|uniref:hypothetical protein n=1 Tax=Rhodanobacter denitrificans TaxID=666685 RepID=UPI001F3AEF6C|nr:hypothetical protein [Rhodanobacter denitrificans]UJJ60621.1 hypothetical protein LRK55_19495 [Rhodanobacter denitrificans]